MSDAVAQLPETLADLIDSRPDLREILATNFNLAHSILLLRRKELEAVDRALELAIRQGNSEALIVAECIRIEMLRMNGDVQNALLRAEALARKERFNVMAVLYFRHLFPLIDASRNSNHAAQLANSVPTHPSEALAGSDSQALHSAHSFASASGSDHDASPEVASADLAAKWRPIANDPTLLLLRIRDKEDLQEIRRAEIGAGALEDQTFGMTSRILDRLGFGALRHCSFDGQDRIIHSWQRPDLQVAAVFQAGPSSSLLAARCTRAFEEQG